MAKLIFAMLADSSVDEVQSGRGDKGSPDGGSEDKEEVSTCDGDVIVGDVIVWLW